jgi:hypothetical protein
MRAGRLVVVVAAACGVAAAACGPIPGPAAPTTTAEPVVVAGGGAPGSLAPGATPSGGQYTPPPPGCFPARDPADPLWLDVARVGDTLVVCADDHRGGERRCWSLDPRTGALGTLDQAVAMPGYAERHGTTVVAGDALIALDADTLTFAGHPPRPLHDAKAKNTLPAAATATWLWLAGDTAYVLGSDGKLYLYEDGKPSPPPFRGLRGGGVGISGGQVVVHEAALSRLTVMDGLSKRVTHGRAHHDEPCHPDDDYAPGNEPDVATACGAHLADHYRPYLRATIIADGDGFVGVDPRGAVFVLDDRLVETARAPVAVCARAP